jgi:hypothetical protein
MLRSTCYVYALTQIVDLNETRAVIMDLSDTLCEFMDRYDTTTQV